MREEQPPFWGWTPRLGRIEITARMELSPRSMASLWLVGREVDPRECAEICVFEVFGETLEGTAAAVGSGLHAFRDPAAREDFATVPLDIDVADFHTYAVDWTVDAVTFSVDGVETRSCAAPPTYPMQAMLAVFDFPERASEADRHHVPRLVVDRISGSPGLSP